MAWLRDKNGAIYRIEAITAVVPLEQRADKRDQAKITDVYAAVTTVGGHTHHTSLDFAEVVKLVNPPPADPTQAAKDTPTS
jgi:hypothetical protein